MAAEQTGNKQLKVVYYNQADYLERKSAEVRIQAAGWTNCSCCMLQFFNWKESDAQRCANRHINMDGITPRTGCSHSAFQGLSKLYMECSASLGMDKDAVEKALRAGHPVVALMGPGDFTKNGHFVVLTRMVGKDKVKIADVGSRARTAETWSLKKVIRQGKEGANAGGPFWEISVKEEKQEEPDYKQKMLDGHKNIDAVTNAIDKIGGLELKIKEHRFVNEKVLE